MQPIPLSKRLFLSLALLAAFVAACAPAVPPAASPPAATTSPPPSSPTTPPAATLPPSPMPEATNTPTPKASPTGLADVIFVKAIEAPDGSWRFDVTVRSPDAGWEDYADGWDVVTPDGQVLKRKPDDPFTRLLLHPHVNEQPFTRSQSGIVIPDGVTQVTVRAHQLGKGYGGREVVVDLTKASGPDFEVVRKSAP